MIPEAYHIWLVSGLLVAALAALIFEWARGDLIAMTAFGVLVLAGVLPANEALSVFQNDAPVTIGALFVLCAALEKTGCIGLLGRMVGVVFAGPFWVGMLVVMAVAGVVSAFLNNTPVVAILLPALLGLSHHRGIAPSRTLMPVSFAVVLGGCGTLIGTSTNLAVSGMLEKYGMAKLAMFELTPVGLPLLAVGIAYMLIAGPRLLPDRPTVTGTVGPEQRKAALFHLLVRPGSPLIGRRLTETVFGTDRAAFRILEVRRRGARVEEALDSILVQPFDRLLVSVGGRRLVELEGGRKELDPAFRAEMGLENLSQVEGGILEGIVGPHSRLIGRTIRSARFRQAFGMLVLALHREGRNLTAEFKDERLEFGDTLLMLGPQSGFDQMRREGDLMVLEESRTPAPVRKRAAVALGVLAAVVVSASAGWVDVPIAALLGCVIVMWTGCIDPDEAYRSIDWSVLFLLYGMLGVGLAMEETGAAAGVAGFLAETVKAHVPAAILPVVMLAVIYLLGNALTEVLSNNAAAVLMVPIAVNTAQGLGLDPRPFVIAVTLSASLAFSSPIGYQTHMMVYGPGGYKFTDFVRFGLPLNVLAFAGACWLIPVFWKF